MDTLYKKELARYFGTLGNEKRLDLILETAKKGSCQNTVPETAGLSRFTVNIHLKQLRKSGWIKGSLQQRNTSWCIDFEAIDRLKAAFDEFYAEINANRFLENTCSSPKNRTYGNQ